jgi:hypothetical protein
MSEKPILDRAFELARSGHFTSTTDIRSRLMKEGYGHAHISGHLGGRGIQQQLRETIAAAWKPSARR